MKILIAPLNWGLGHATRCIPLVRHYLAQGNEIVLAGDGDSLLLLRKTFPQLRVIDLPPLDLRYTTNEEQRGFYIRAIWKLLRFTIADHYYLRKTLAIEHFDLVISDNRFGLFSSESHCVYITHQLYPILPHRLKIFQPFARALHARIYKRYSEVWVPDYANATHNLSGNLSHGGRFDKHAKYIGPLSRFQCSKELKSSNCLKERSVPSILILLSGLEPQRTIFERELIERFAQTPKPVLLIRGKVAASHTTIQRGNITIQPSITDEDLIAVTQQANLIIARSGYSTIMDLEILGVLHKAELHPTPGQSEQEYLLTQINIFTNSRIN